jgi:Xaa-Pro aminopeptidase
MSFHVRLTARTISLLLLLVSVVAAPIGLSAQALQKQPFSDYRARRVALAAKLNGGVAVLFAAEQPLLDFMPYRQDSDFYYFTGWNEPGAALMIVADKKGAGTGTDVSRSYREILFLPTRNLRMEKYTGIKLDAATPNAPQSAGVDEVLPMVSLPAELNKLTAADRGLTRNLWAEPDSAQSKSLVSFVATTLGLDTAPLTHDLTGPTTELRQIKDSGELALLKRASDASIAAQRVMMQSAHPGVTERSIAGKIISKLMDEGCERPSYAPIVGTGINSTTLHYSNNTATLADGDLIVVDAAGECSMYASDITRTLPVNGHFTPRQREVYEVVLGAQRAAAEAFVAGKSTINGSVGNSDSLDSVAWNYIHDHGKGPHGEPLSNYWIHGLGHMVGIDVHDPAIYPAVLKPGMVFTIEPGVYVPEEKIGVRIEDVFVVGEDGKLIDLVASLPHTADEVEAAMHSDN